MSDSNSSLDPVIAVKLCHEFEAAWSADRQTDFMPFLDKVPDEHRLECFRMLLEIEYERRQQAGQDFDPILVLGTEYQELADKIGNDIRSGGDSQTHDQAFRKAAISYSRVVKKVERAF